MRNPRTISRTGVLTVGLIAALGAATATAQPTPPPEQPTLPTAQQPAQPAQPAEPDQATRDQARTRFRAGQAAFEAQSWEPALTEFRAANELIPSGRALVSIGQCLRKLNREIEALQTFRQYVELYPNPTVERDRTELQSVRGWIDEIEETVGKVQVSVAVSGATVLVDGQVVGQAPLGQPVELTQGSHTFRAEADGYRPAEEAVTVTGGQEVQVTLVPAPLQTTATVNLSSNVPEASAALDGQPLGTLPYAGEVEAGVHQLEVTAEGYEAVHLSITLEAGQPFNRAVELAPAPEAAEAWYEKWWVWTIAGVVVGGATAGIVLGATSGESMPDSDWTLGLP